MMDWIYFYFLTSLSDHPHAPITYLTPHIHTFKTSSPFLVTILMHLSPIIHLLTHTFQTLPCPI